MGSGRGARSLRAGAGCAGARARRGVGGGARIIKARLLCRTLPSVSLCCKSTFRYSARTLLRRSSSGDGPGGVGAGGVGAGSAMSPRPREAASAADRHYTYTWHPSLKKGLHFSTVMCMYAWPTTCTIFFMMPRVGTQILSSAVVCDARDAPTWPPPPRLYALLEYSPSLPPLFPSRSACSSACSARQRSSIQPRPGLAAAVRAACHSVASMSSCFQCRYRH